MITINSCPVCGSIQITKYKKFGIAPQIAYEVMPGVNVNAVVLSHYSVCQNCSVIFQNPRLSDSELNRFYGEGIYRRTLNLTSKEKDKDEEYRAKFDAKIINKYIGKVKSHLDVGASRGFLLREIGANVKVGIEEDVKGVTQKGIKVYRRMDEVPRKSFDLVTAIHTLEHVPDPLGYLRGLVKEVGSNGYVSIEVPTWKSTGGPLRLAHLYHFEPHVLRRMCMDVGLKIVHEEFTPHFFVICQKEAK